MASGRAAGPPLPAVPPIAAEDAPAPPSAGIRAEQMPSGTTPAVSAPGVVDATRLGLVDAGFAPAYWANDSVVETATIPRASVNRAVRRCRFIMVGIGWLLGLMAGSSGNRQDRLTVIGPFREQLMPPFGGIDTESRGGWVVNALGEELEPAIPATEFAPEESDLDAALL